MDTIIPQPIPPTGAVKPLTKILILIVLVIVLIVGAWWYASRQPRSQEVQSVAELNSSLNAITATTTVTVPTTADPLKSATPAVNPIEKTNPFNNAYNNPFQ